MENVYFTDDGNMIDLDEVVAATWGNRDNDVVFVRMRGDQSEHATMIRPGGGALLAALRERRTAKHEGLLSALAFAAVQIKAGLPWTPECEERIAPLLKGRGE